ncbi:MAG TPA: nucleotide exchange factor GrpE [Bacteroidetes bacterium]|nr:nucleotide exchange factor GrpE [Bacteroidota bacterium]
MAKKYRQKAKQAKAEQAKAEPVEVKKGNEKPADSNQNGEEAQKVKEEVEQEVDPIVELQNQLDEAKDKYIRLSAEFDNYRKRTQREKMDLIKYGSEDVMKAILPLVDDFERAIKHSQTATDVDALKQGIVLIHGKFTEFLKNNGVHVIEAEGKELDTDMHEAVTKIPAPSDELKGKIVDVVEKGYKLNDKVIRFSKVVIGE